MIEWIKKHWRDPVWSSVIATSLVAMFTYFLDWWPLFIRAILAVWEFVISSTSVSNWLLGIMIITCLLLILIIAIWYVVWKKNIQYLKINAQPNWRNYITDNFFNIRWTWRYDETNKMVDLYSFCPNCDFQIYPKRYSNFVREFTHINYHCENCGRDFGNFSDDIAQFENMIIRHAQRKMRNGEWMNTQSSN